MDKMIRKIEKNIKKDEEKELKELKKLEIADKKRDRLVTAGKKALRQKNV